MINRMNNSSKTVADTFKKTIFIGRKEQLNQLLNCLDESKSITVIVGEEGIGKSSLLHEFTKR